MPRVLFQDMEIADRIAELGEKMFFLERRGNLSQFPAKTCRDLQRCHLASYLPDGN